MSQTFKLTKPIQFLGEQMGEITLKEPDFGAIMRAEQKASKLGGGENTTVGALIAELGGLSMDAVSQLHPKDGLGPMKQYILDFLPGGQPIGES